MLKKSLSKSCKLRHSRTTCRFLSSIIHSELKRDLYTANFVFAFQSRVPNELIPITLGLTISYFREDEAFK